MNPWNTALREGVAAGSVASLLSLLLRGREHPQAWRLFTRQRAQRGISWQSRAAPPASCPAWPGRA